MFISVSQVASRKGLVPSDQLAALFHLIGELAAPSPNSTPVLHPRPTVKRAEKELQVLNLTGFVGQHHLLKQLRLPLVSTKETETDFAQGHR